MENDEFKKDLKKIQNRVLGQSMSSDWHQLKTRIIEFMNITRRTWGTAVLYLLEKGLEAHERDETAIRGHKQTDL